MSKIGLIFDEETGEILLDFDGFDGIECEKEYERFKMEMLKEGLKYTPGKKIKKVPNNRVRTCGKNKVG